MKRYKYRILKNGLEEFLVEKKEYNDLLRTDIWIYEKTFNDFNSAKVYIEANIIRIEKIIKNYNLAHNIEIVWESF